MKSHLRLHINYTLEKKKIESTLFDSVGSSKSIEKGAIEEEKLKQLIQV